MEILKFNYQTCQKPGFHQGETLSRVCLEEKCKQNSLGCSICFQEEHKGHKIKSLKGMISHVKKYLENDKEVIDEDDFANFLQQCKQKTKESFEKLQSSVIHSIQKIEQQSDHFYEDLLQKFKVKFPNAATRDQIMKILQNISDNEDSISELNQKIQLILQVDPSIRSEKTQLASQSEIKQKINKLEQNNLKKTESIRTNIEKILQDFENILKNQYKNNLEKEKFFQQSNLSYPFIFNGETKLIEHEPGIDYENNPSSHQEQIIYSEQTFEDGQHGYQLELVKFEPSSSLCFLIGVVEESKILDSQVSTTSGQPWSCLFNTCKGYMIHTSQHFGDVCPQGGILNIKMDFEENTYTVTDSEEKLKYEMDPTQYTLEGKKLKFFISFFSSELNARVRILDTY